MVTSDTQLATASTTPQRRLSGGLGPSATPCLIAVPAFGLGQGLWLRRVRPKT